MSLPETQRRLAELLREAAQTRADLDPADGEALFAYTLGKLRDSGVTDPAAEMARALEIGTVLLKLDLDRSSLAAALLYPLVSNKLLDESFITSHYSVDLSSLVAHLNKLAGFSFNSEAKQEEQRQSFRKMILAFASDIRVLFVWLAARLIRLREAAEQPDSSERIRMARETLDIYTPLAGRLGIGVIKGEMENLAFRRLHPDDFTRIDGFLSRYQADQRVYIEETVSTIQRLLRENGLTGKVYGRVKHTYSTWRKMQLKNLALDQLYDLIAFRVIVPDLETCYRVLGLVHSQWRPIQGMFEDYIAMPKPNGYQSLHTLVIGAHGERMEVQIRTAAMHEVAENGLAAHWRYKEIGSKKAGEDSELELVRWLRRLIDEQRRTDGESVGAVFETLSVDLFSDIVFAFTPQGDVLELPKSASVIDAAFAIHTHVGLHAVGAKLNGRLVPFKTTLKSGDVVEIITNKTQKPSKEWLEFAITNRARQKIRHALREEDRESSRLLGRELCEREFKRFDITLNRVEKSGDLDKIAADLKHRDFAEALIAIGRGKLRVRDLLERLIPDKLATYEAEQERLAAAKLAQQAKPKPAVRRKPSPSGVIVAGAGDIALRFAKCCAPVPGDPIMGFVTRGRGLTVHHALCPKLPRHEPERLIEASWDENAGRELSARLKVRILDKPGMIKAVSDVFSASGVNITSMHAKLVRKVGEVTFTFTLRSMEQLDHVIGDIRRQKGVLSVQRPSTGNE